MDNEKVPCGIVGPDLIFDETTTVKNSLEERLGVMNNIMTVLVIVAMRLIQMIVVLKK